MNSLDLGGRVAVVLGGSSGIGRSLALGLAEAGARVVVSARRSEQLAQVCEEIRASGGTSRAITSDVTDRATLEALLEQCEQELGAVDILVNAAGITVRRPTLELAEAEWQRILDCNLTGTLRSCQIFGRRMLDRGYGRIINIASLSSFVAFHEVAAYGVSKAGVVALTQSLAVEWGPRGVCVNAIAPGVFPTELNSKLLQGTERGHELLLRTPQARFGRTEELAGACVYLASEAASFTNGAVLPVDGGFLASGVNR
ncbi:MAG TPA: glucose 1-dehydrogenase [Polyangiaceae bacterium]|nr:glucose 1-dehydrogenase [Polyangiaceae bacterium]